MAPLRSGVGKLFISHSSRDDAFVRDLREALAEHGLDGWIDSRELRGGDPLWPEIQRAIDEASAYAVLVSPDGLQSKWVGKELRYALEVQKQSGKDRYPVLPLSLNETKLGVLEEFFAEQPLYIAVDSDPGGIEAAVNEILVAVGERLPADVAETAQPEAEPLEDLVLELTDLKFHEHDGVRRPSARARLVYEPATPGRPHVHSPEGWRLVAPIGPIEAEELRWYLEKYAVWPSHYFHDRAARVEKDLATWGRLLHQAAMPVAQTVNVLQAWAGIDDLAGRRFSVLVDPAPETGASEEEVAAAKEAATLLLGLPWELLHDGEGYLFQGGRPVRVRRRLPNTRVLDVPVVAPPIRILLVTARPEDEACSYFDHRASALPLVDAMEALPGLVRLHVLSPPTLPALREELDRARNRRQPYHVVHFDGHGIYDRNVGLGGLCFEHPEDAGLLENRRHVTVYTEDLGPLLRDHRIPLVFLEACQTGLAEKASESVASELLKVGVASVVAMSHSVLVETARRFVAVFYRALAEGKRVGDAMLAGQRALEGDKSRGRVFGADELKLHDWFVPVLYQEKDDPQLFRTMPARQSREGFQTALAARLGDLPPAPETGFVGRSRDLLALERLLRGGAARYAVVRGQGGEGKTALAAELARWLVRSHQVRRAAFVSVEGLEKNITEVVLDRLGEQLVKKGFSTQADCQGDIGKAEQEVVRVLRERPTLLVVDNMESVLLPQFLADETPEALTEAAREELATLLALCERLLAVGETRLIFTSREALPAPFDAERQRRELHQLDREDAVKLVERVIDVEGAPPPSDRRLQDARREEIERLVDAVHSHARTLALLAPALRSRGVEATRESLVELMAEMEERFPGSRERSVFASVELSLRRMSAANRERARVLGVFHGGVQLGVLHQMTGWQETDVASLAGELIESGLATPNRYGHLTLSLALCPYQRARLDAAERESLTACWVEAMHPYVGFLVQQHFQNAEIYTVLTVLELPNLFALLDLVERARNAEATIELATLLYSLLQMLGKPRLLEQVGRARDIAATVLGDAWNHARFEAARTLVEQELASGRLREAVDEARRLLARARGAGEQAYLAADYDLAGACWLLARVLKAAGGSGQALPLLGEARGRFEAFERHTPGRGAARMVSVCLTEHGDCLRNLGRLDEAAAAYEESIRRAEQLDDARQGAIAKLQLGTVRLLQHRYSEALVAFAEARERFTELNEPGTVSVAWHQTGVVLQRADQPEAAEEAYRNSLAIEVRLGNIAGQATTLNQLGNLYQTVFVRPEEAVAFFRQAADKYVELGDAAAEGHTRSNLAGSLYELRRLNEARREVSRAIKCKEPYGHTAEPWKSWSILADIEAAASNPGAAADARAKAVDSYLAYRRDGGENHFPDGRLALAVTQALLADDPATAASLIEQQASKFEAAGFGGFVHALQALSAGSRDRALAESPGLYCSMAAEILFLIETLEAR